MSSSGVYEIPCSYGMSYIGKIGRSFKAQLKEHMADNFHNYIEKSEIAEQYHSTKHLISFDNTKILASAPYHSTRVIMEALEIEKHPHNFNQDDGYHLSNSWKPTIHLLSSKPSPANSKRNF